MCFKKKRELSAREEKVNLVREIYYGNRNLLSDCCNYREKFNDDSLEHLAKKLLDIKSEACNILHENKISPSS